MSTFRAMNTEVSVTSTHGDEAAIVPNVAALFARAELHFSRFREDSELARLNRARGPVSVSETMFDALTRARAFVELTNGMFDPAIGGTLGALGYDRSFAPHLLDRATSPTPPRAGRFLDVRLDPATRTVERPPHVRIDLGGMIKGSTVDEAGRFVHRGGAVDAGGDAVVRGPGPEGDAWFVDVEDPMRPERSVATLALEDGAVATSSANRRFWRVGDTVRHHLIDPRTQAPAVSDLLQATVVARTAERADVFAKTLFLLGRRDARRFLARHAGVGAVLVRTDGTVEIVGDVDVREVNHG